MPRDANTSVSLRDYQQGRILAALADGPLTAQQLADKVHLSRSGVLWHLRALGKAPRWVCIVGYAPAPVGHRRAPLHGLGDKKDAPYPRSRVPKGVVTVEDRKAQILKLIGARQMSSAEVAESMSLQRARQYVCELHAAGKLYIAAWRARADGGSSVPLYAVGSLPDVPRPAPMTEHQKNARHWAKLKADPHRHGLLLQRNRLRKKPATWASALFM